MPSDAGEKLQRPIRDYAYWLVVTSLLVVFGFNLALAVYVSPVALVLMLGAVTLAIPAIQRRLASSPVLKTTGLRQSIVIVAACAAIYLLVNGDKAPPALRINTAYIGATIVTGHEDAAPIPDGVVLVNEFGQITAVGAHSDITVPDDHEIVELQGKFLMPGLINAHDHLMMFGDREPWEPADFSTYATQTPPGLGEWIVRTYPVRRMISALMEKNAQKALYGGVTTVRELATIESLDVDLRERIARGERIGPRILAAGMPLCITGGHGHQIGRIVSGPVEARDAVRESIASGIDVIKVTSTGGVADSHRIGEAGELQMTPDEIRAIVDEAHRKNLLVAAHAESSEGVLEALRAGVDNIEHGASLDAEAIGLFLNNPLSLRGYSTLHPTLSVLAGGVLPADENNTSERLQVINTNAEMVHKELISGFQSALASGVHIGVGTDSGVVSHDSVWVEMKLFTEHGDVSNQQAIHMGTLGTARSIGIEQTTGSIEPGKSADFLVVSSDPLEDLSALSTPYLVVAQGKRYRP